MFIAYLADRRQIIIGRYIDASLALYRLEDNGCGIIGDSFFERFNIAERNHLESRHERLKGLFVGLATDSRESKPGMAVVGFLCVDDFFFHGVATGNFDCGIIGFSATDAEDSAREIPGSDLG